MRYTTILIFGLVVVAGCDNSHGGKLAGNRTTEAFPDVAVASQKDMVPVSIVNEIRAYYLQKYVNFFQAAQKSKVEVSEVETSDLLRLVFTNVPQQRGDYEGYIASADIPRVRADKNIYGPVPVLTGDMNGDGAEDLVISVHYSDMNSGNDREPQDIFVFLSEHGRYRLAGVTPDLDLCGCTFANNFFQQRIDSGVLIGKTVCYGTKDMMCCPTLTYIVRTKLEGDKLVYVSKELLTLP